MDTDLESWIEVHLMEGNWEINWETKVFTFWGTEEIRVTNFGRPGYSAVIIDGQLKVVIHTVEEDEDDDLGDAGAKEERVGLVSFAAFDVYFEGDNITPVEWASEHCSAPFRAPELWDCPSHADIDERTDIWSLGCTLYAIMYGVSPFEYALGESGGSLQLAIVNAQVKWPAGPKPPYPEALHQFVTWMLQPQPTVRPQIDDIIIHVDKLIAKFSP